MGKKKLTDSEIRLLLVFLSALMLVAAYFLSFQKNMDLAQEMEARNEEDRDYIEMLESMISRRSQIEAQTEGYHQAIDEIIAKYPSELPTEKAIEIIHEMENRTGVQVNNISFSMENVVVGLSGNEAAYAEEKYTDEDYLDEEYLDEAYLDEAYMEEEYTESAGGQEASAVSGSAGYRDTISMSYVAAYSDLKRMIAYVEGLSDRTTIPSITAAYDSGTDNISGSITINMFYLTKTEREYEEPVVPGRKGVTNIFRSGGGTAVTVTEPVVEEGEEENGEEQEDEEVQEDNG